ncbi:MAG TPA: pyridoxal phosphate-dependent aminotransferase [Gemmataceae bacterium]|nr:pyridoxal phosphate-dependent aminotransferase [Gemmataceae bacterium]
MRRSLFLARCLVRAGLARWLPRARRALGSAVDPLRYCSDEVLGLPVEMLREAAGAVSPVGPDVLDLTQGPESGKSIRLTGQNPLADRQPFTPVQGSWELRHGIGVWMERELRLTRDPQNEILVTLGATGALQTALATFVNRRDRIVLFEPTSPLFEILAAARGARIQRVPTRMEDGKIRFGVDCLAKSLRGARMILLANPANPQGGVLSDADLEQIAWWAAKRDVLIYSDDVFASFIYDQPSTNIGCLPRAFRRTLSAGSVTMSHCQPGLRVGWLTADRALLRPCVGIAAVRAAFVPALCQQIAVTLLEQPVEELHRLRDELASRRQYAFERLQAMGFQPEWPAGGHFFWLDTNRMGMSGAVFAEKLFREKRVRVSPGSLFGPNCAGFVRLSYAGEDGRLRTGLGRIAEFLTGETTRPARAA